MENILTKCRAFVCAVETGSFTKAAAELHYAQSSVSKMIADLEQEWGVPLLERGRRGVCLTACGQQLLPMARRMLHDHRELEECVQRMQGVQTGQVRIGTFASVAIHWLPNIFAQLQKDCPGIEYEMLLGNYDEVERWIEEGRVDCGFLRLPTTRGFDTVLLKRDEYKVVLPVGHPLAAQEIVDIAALNGQPFLLLEHGGKTEVSALLEGSGVRPDIRFTTWEDFAIMAMVERGLGVSILPSMILQRIPYRLAIRPLERPFFREIGLATKSRVHLTPAAQRFMEYLPFREDTGRE